MMRVASFLLPGSFLTGLLFGVGCSEYSLDGTADAAGGETTPTDSGTEPVTTPSSGTPGTPALSLDPDLELISSCWSTAAGEITAESVGDAPLTITDVALDGSGELYLDALSLPATLAPTERLQIPVIWEPSSGEDVAATVQVISDDPAATLATSAITGALAFETTDPRITVDVLSCMLVPEDEVITLSAALFDDGPTSDLIVRWESDLDGVLFEGPPDGMGTSTIEVLLSGGDHTITVTAEDTCSGLGRETFDITVLPYEGTYGLQGPDGLSFDATGYLWVADWETDRVHKMNPWTLETLWSFALPYEGADGLTLMGDAILVSFYYTNQVVFLDTCTGAETASWPSPTPGGISDVSWDGTDLWVVDYTQQDIHRVDPGTGASLDVFDAPYAYSNGLAFDGADFWLTANSSSDRIARLNTDFEVLENFSHAGSDPRGIAFDGTYIWWSDATDGILDILTSP